MVGFTGFTGHTEALHEIESRYQACGWKVSFFISLSGSAKVFSYQKQITSLWMESKLFHLIICKSVQLYKAVTKLVDGK